MTWFIEEDLHRKMDRAHYVGQGLLLFGMVVSCLAMSVKTVLVHQHHPVPGVVEALIYTIWVTLIASKVCKWRWNKLRKRRNELWEQA